MSEGSIHEQIQWYAQQMQQLNQQPTRQGATILPQEQNRPMLAHGTTPSAPMPQLQPSNAELWEYVGIEPEPGKRGGSTTPTPPTAWPTPPMPTREKRQQQEISTVEDWIALCQNDCTVHNTMPQWIDTIAAQLRTERPDLQKRIVWYFTKANRNWGMALEQMLKDKKNPTAPRRS